MLVSLHSLPIKLHMPSYGTVVDAVQTISHDSIQIGPTFDSKANPSVTIILKWSNSQEKECHWKCQPFSKWRRWDQSQRAEFQSRGREAPTPSPGRRRRPTDGHRLRQGCSSSDWAFQWRERLQAEAPLEVRPCVASWWNHSYAARRHTLKWSVLRCETTASFGWTLPGEKTEKKWWEWD